MTLLQHLKYPEININYSFSRNQDDIDQIRDIEITQRCYYIWIPEQPSTFKLMAGIGLSDAEYFDAFHKELNIS